MRIAGVFCLSAPILYGASIVFSGVCGYHKRQGVSCMDAGKIGKLIYELRKEKHMTQRALAERLLVSDKAVSKWERGVSLR